MPFPFQLSQGVLLLSHPIPGHPGLGGVSEDKTGSRPANWQLQWRAPRASLCGRPWAPAERDACAHPTSLAS